MEKKKLDQDKEAQGRQLREESTPFGKLDSFLSDVSAFYIISVMQNVCVYIFKPVLTPHDVFRSQ